MIGADYGLEQENRAIKVTGGINGISNNENALSDYFPKAEVMGNIVESFSMDFGLDDKFLWMTSISIAIKSRLVGLYVFSAFFRK